MTLSSLTDTVIVGAGQAGLSLSRFLTEAGHRHVVLDRGRIGERWRSERWDSLSLLTPTWLNLLPGQARTHDPDGFLAVPQFVAGLEAYASSFDAPVVEGITVLAVEGAPRGFRVTTDRGPWTARNVVIAAGDSADPALPAISASTPAGLGSLHSSRYRSPDRLAPGGVLVVGAGPSGQQLALELARAGRKVTIAAGRHARMPRRYRGRDIWHWLVALGHVSERREEIADLEAVKRSPSLPLSGAHGGEQLDLSVLHRAGVRVAGRLRGFAGHHALFEGDLDSEVAAAEQRMRRMLSGVDDLVRRTGIDAPTEDVPEIELPPAPAALDLQAEPVTSVIWATGYRRSYPWLRVPVLDERGEIVQEGGATSAAGLYTLGLKLQRTRSSHTIGGVGADAEVLAQRIVAGSVAEIELRAA